MRATVIAIALATAAPWAQTSGHDRVLDDMRQALGGAPVLDAITTLSIDGDASTRRGTFANAFAQQVFVLLPDRFLVVRRDSRPGGPMPIDITYYRGFRGDELIKRTDANIPFPPEPGPHTPQAIAPRRLEQTQRNKQEFARLALVLFGASFSGYPLAFGYAGQEAVDGRPADVVEGRHSDGFAVRMFVDATTHLPIMLSWQDKPIVTFVTSSSSIVKAGPRGSEVLGHTPAQVPAADPAAGLPLVEHRLIVSDFERQDGLNWPRRLQHVVGKDVVEDIKVRRFRINPRMDPRKFEIR
jgi:hypothetical protein